MANKVFIENEQVYRALKEIARNLVYFTDNPLPAYPDLQGGGFFAVCHDGDKKAEVVVHGVTQEELPDIISLLNTFNFYTYNIFRKDVRNKVRVKTLLPYVVLCNDKTYMSKISGKTVTFV